MAQSVVLISRQALTQLVQNFQAVGAANETDMTDLQSKPDEQLGVYFETFMQAVRSWPLDTTETVNANPELIASTQAAIEELNQIFGHNF